MEEGCVIVVEQLMKNWYKKILISLFVSLSVLNISYAALTTNLAPYYKLDSGALVADSNSTYTLTNNNTVGEGAAFIGTASADFGTANTNKFLNVTNDLGTDGGAISISFWVKMRTEITTGSQGFIIHGGATSHVNDMVGYDYNGGTRRLAWNRQQQNTANNVSYYTATLGTATWHHIVYTYDGANMNGYYDGALVVGPVALSGNGASGTGDGFGLGGTNRGGGNEWYGYSSVLIDEVGVWTRAITSTEVTSLYNGGAGFAYPFTVAVSTPPTLGFFMYYNKRR